jgi:hypothetical protein
MADPFTIRIFVPDGDPEGVRLIDRMNWTGVGLAFPRSRWSEVSKRAEMRRAGVYILVGYRGDDQDLPTLYIGQSEDVGRRLQQHYDTKDFWNWAILFTSNSGGLNRAHVMWLEHALIRRAREAGRSHPENEAKPNEPALSEAEKADTQGFLKEMLQILPLVGLRAFEIPKPVATPHATHPSPLAVGRKQDGLDTIIVPAQKEGFEKVFLGEDCWHAIRISGGMLDKIKYIAAYQTQPVSAITHYAPVSRIEPYGEGGKYKLVFSEKATAITPIPFGEAPSGAMQGPRYVAFSKLQSAKTLSDLLDKG